MHKSFDYYRSTNNRLFASLVQQDSYNKYLQRIDSIVNKKPHPDLSTSQSMTFRNKMRQIATHYHESEHLAFLNSENTILMNKIIHAKKRSGHIDAKTYSVAMHEKRIREHERINEENKKIAKRVINQKSTIKVRKSSTSQQRESPRRINEKIFYESRIKQRKLPKLMQIRS